MTAQPGTPGSERGAVEALAAVLEGHYWYFDNKPQCKCGWNRAGSNADVAFARHLAEVTLAADREPGLREELAALADECIDTKGGPIAGKVAIAHEQRRGGCKCGAEIGDSIDWHWHLVNQAVSATGEALRAILDRGGDHA